MLAQSIPVAFRGVTGCTQGSCLLCKKSICSNMGTDESKHWAYPEGCQRKQRLVRIRLSYALACIPSLRLRCLSGDSELLHLHLVQGSRTMKHSCKVKQQSSTPTVNHDSTAI